MQLHNGDESALAKYKKRPAATFPFSAFAFMNALHCCSPTSVVPWVMLYARLRRSIFRSISPGLILRRGLVVRHPGRISFGANMTFDLTTQWELFASDDNYATDIERNLMYVACTHAMHTLTLAFAGKSSPFISRA